MKQILCPNCRKPTYFVPENSSRPFCSERCKLIDLGEWADGKYSIPLEEPLEDLISLELSEEEKEK